MWVVEVNVLGRKFMHRTGDHHRALGFTPGLAQLRHLRDRLPRVAA